MGRIQKYVSDFSQKMDDRIERDSVKAFSLWMNGKLQEVEKLFEEQYKYLRKLEKKLPEGRRYHKGGALHNWGLFMLMQDIPEKTPEAYKNITLAYIEDLLDFDTVEEAHNAPAYNTLKEKPFIFVAFAELLQQEVKRRKRSGRIPRDPSEILMPLSGKAETALSKPAHVSLEHVRHGILAWLEQRGEAGERSGKEKRVFVGGAYRNIALLKHIAEIVKHLGFTPIMPIDMPTASEESHEELIHDISIEMLKECAFAIFEVTISDGHLMEIERSRDFEDMKVILVYQTFKQNERPTATRMLMSKNFEKKGYRNFSELAIAIGNFLPEKPKK